MVQNIAFGAIIVLGLKFPSRPPWARLTLIALAFVGFAVASVFHGRGAKIAVVGAMLAGSLLYFSPGGGPSLSRRLAVILLITLVFIVPLASLVYGNLFERMQLDRFEAGPDTPGTSAYWRQVWWESLIKEVFHRDPIFGIGFGENLGAYSPYLTRDHLNPWPLRAPHNFNITILARMGLIGLALWGLVLAIGLGRLIGAQWKPRRDEHRSELALWLMFLAATWVNATFGVLMEGPVLGIPFWFILGFAIGRETMTRGSAAEITPQGSE